MASSTPPASSNRGRLCIGSDSQATVCPAEELRWLEYQTRLRKRRRAVLAESSEPHVGTRLWREAARQGAAALGQPAGAIAEGARADWLVLDPEHASMAGARAASCARSSHFRRRQRGHPRRDGRRKLGGEGPAAPGGGAARGPFQAIDGEAGARTCLTITRTGGAGTLRRPAVIRMRIYSAAASFGLHAIVIAMLLQGKSPQQPPPPSLPLAVVMVNDGTLDSPNDLRGSAPDTPTSGLGSGLMRAASLSKRRADTRLMTPVFG